MYNNFIMRVVEFFKDVVAAFCEQAADYASSLTFRELVAVSFFVGLLSLVVIYIVFCSIRNRINKNIARKRSERKALFHSDTRLDRQCVQNEIISESDEDAGGAEKNGETAFDWSPASKHGDALSHIVSGENLQYRLKPHRLVDLLGLIVDLLSRDVEDAKLAQVIMHKNQHLNSEDDIIYTIAAIKMFVKMSKNGAFKKIDTKKILPNEIVALFNLAHGDCSLVLILIEAYVDDAIDKLKNFEDSDRQKKYVEIADLCVCFGTLAMFEDVGLAKGSFELAIELNPQNSVAWGRLGDAYRQAQNMDKAVWAYMNVLNLGDEQVYTQQMANAEKILAFYYRENGKKEQAVKMGDNSKSFYEKLGINVPLTEREDRIVYIIETNEQDNIENIVERLLLAK
ncbi:MAG: hypothetical protein J6Y53_04555 [Alphaproteobacteria bacterium]|nr:hypothetical protein [Alphaproteobacteria bacterium]